MTSSQSRRASWISQIPLVLYLSFFLIAQYHLIPCEVLEYLQGVVDNLLLVRLSMLFKLLF